MTTNDLPGGTEVLDAITPQQAVATLRNTAIAELNAVDAGIAALRESYEGKSYEVATTRGMEDAKKARADIRDRRYKVPHIVKCKKDDLKQIASAIDSEGERIVAALLELETPIHEQIKDEEDRKASEKAGRERAEREAAANVQAEIDGIKHIVVSAVGLPSSAIQSLIDGLLETPITLEAFGDRAGEAQQAKMQAAERLRELHASALAQENMQAQLEAQRAELARLTAESEAREKEDRERAAAEQQAAADKLAADRAAFEREQAEARAEAQKREDADRARRDEEDRIAREARAAEEKRIADARAALEAEQRATREAQEAKEAAERKAAQAVADAAAEAERQRLDEEAAARRAEEQRLAEEARAEQQRKGEERERLEAANQRVRDAAPALLDALRVMVHKATKQNWNDHYPDELAQAYAAIDAATGEPA